MLVRGEKHYDRPRPFPKDGDYDIHEDGGLFADRQAARFAARRMKLLEPPSVPPGSWLLWMDASMVPKVPLNAVVEDWLSEGHHLALMKHPERDCAYDEVDVCVERRKLDKRKGHQIKAFLAMRGLPKNYGLWACGVIAWRHACKELRERWWSITVHTGLRDQVALPMALFDLGLRDRLRTVHASIWKNDWFEWVPHGR